MKNIKKANGATISCEEFLEDIGCKDHIEDILLPAIKSGDWGKLNELAVIPDDSSALNFKDNVWSLKSFGEGYEPLRLLFNHSTRKNFDGYILPMNITNEIKSFACVELFTDHGKYGYKSICDTVSKLTVIAKCAAELGFSSFSEIDEDAINRMIDNGLIVNDKGNKTLSAINRIVQCQDALPIHIDINRSLKPTHFNLAQATADQHLAIPYRIYFSVLNHAISNIKEAYKNRIALEAATEEYLAHSEDIKNHIFARLRNGEIEAKTAISGYTGWDWVSIVDGINDVFKNNDVPFVDYEKDERWEDVWSLCKGNDLNISAVNKELRDGFNATVGDQKFTGRDDLQQYIRDLQADATFVCMALSGMRISELFGLSPVYGAQDHIKVGATTVYAFTTKQEKLTLDSQTADDVYITNLTGFKAFHILNAIHKPYRERFKTGSKSIFFAALRAVYAPTPIQKVGLGQTIRKTINRNYEDIFTLEQSDIEALRASNPLNSNLPKFGEVFSYTNHQCRRSFSYYLIGLELMDFPQLKQQLGHISMVMTRWYANNAHSFKKLYSEVEDERTLLTSAIFSRIYNKLANKERLAGGLGKSLSKATIENENFFSEGINDRKLETKFWLSEIKTGKVHLHAIGKGMYCTKRQCAMRASIDLSECNDCAWDIIEDARSVESLRMTAMRNLLIALEEGELNGSSATKLIMDIRSTEKIMGDLGFPFEPFNVPIEAKLMIKVKEVS